jgi:hypothetical protein
VIAISEDREPANGGAHPQEAQARLIPSPLAGALPQVWCCARTLGDKDAARGYYYPDSNAGPAFLSTPVQNDPAQQAQATAPKLTSTSFGWSTLRPQAKAELGT